MWRLFVVVRLECVGVCWGFHLVLFVLLARRVRVSFFLFRLLLCVFSRSQSMYLAVCVCWNILISVKEMWDYRKGFILFFSLGDLIKSEVSTYLVVVY